MYKVVKIDYDINLTEVSNSDTFDEAKKKLDDIIYAHEVLFAADGDDYASCTFEDDGVCYGCVVRYKDQITGLKKAKKYIVVDMSDVDGAKMDGIQ